MTIIQKTREDNSGGEKGGKKKEKQNEYKDIFGKQRTKQLEKVIKELKICTY